MTYWCILLYCEMHHRPRWNERTTMDDVVSSVRLNTLLNKANTGAIPEFFRGDAKGIRHKCHLCC